MKLSTTAGLTPARTSALSPSRLRMASRLELVRPARLRQGFARVSQSTENSSRCSTVCMSSSLWVSRSPTAHSLFRCRWATTSCSLENSDKFINLVSVRVVNWQQLTTTDQPHGLLGQTWSNGACDADKRRSRRLNKDSTMSLADVIEGDVDDYALSSEDMFGTDSLYNRFVVA